MTSADPPPSVPGATPSADPPRRAAAGRTGSPSRQPVLQRVVDLAQHVTPDVVAVSVTALDAGRLRTVTTTGPGATVLDELQRRTVVVDLTDAGTAPGLARLGRALGVRHVLAVGLPGPRAESLALTLYGPEPFTLTAVALVEALARSAAGALRPTRPRPTAVMHDALRARAAVEQATGVVMAAHRCPPDEALALLSAAAASQGCGLDEVAGAVLADAGRG